MKRSIVMLALAAVLALVGWNARGVGKDLKSQPERAVHDLMKQKLTHAQKVLEGISLADYGMIARNAEELIQVSKRAEWMVVRTPRYELYSNDFRRAAAELADNSRKHQLEAATLSYMDLTMSCVRCHKYVREIREARLDGRADTKPVW